MDLCHKGKGRSITLSLSCTNFFLSSSSEYQEGGGIYILVILTLLFSNSYSVSYMKYKMNWASLFLFFLAIVLVMQLGALSLSLWWSFYIVYYFSGLSIHYITSRLGNVSHRPLFGQDCQKCPFVGCHLSRVVEGQCCDLLFVGSLSYELYLRWW